MKPSILQKLYRLNLEKVFIRLGIDKRLKQWVKSAKKASINHLEMRNPDTTPTRYIHIGYPKAASTALQRGFFGKHPQLLHLGCGNPTKKDYWDDHGYIDAEINTALEIDLRYKSKFAYSADDTRKAFAKHFKRSRKDLNIHAIGISNENICFNWHGGIDTTEKASRLKDIFGDDTQIIIICRNQVSLITSLYKETVRFGYSGSFDKYLEYLWKYRDRNYFYDFSFLNIHKLYSELFGVSNTHLLFFEEIKNDQAGFLKRITEILEVDNSIKAIDGQFNEQLSNKELSIKLDLNKRLKHSFEKGYLSPFDTHRYVPYLTSISPYNTLDNEDYIDYYIRNGLNKVSMQLSDKVDINEIDLSWTGYYGDRIREFYSKANNEMNELLDLPQLSIYGYLSL